MAAGIADTLLSMDNIAALYEAKASRNVDLPIIRMRLADMLRVQTSFQDTPGAGYFFVLIYNDRPLHEQVDDLALKDGEVVLLWEPDCGDYTLEATLLFNYQHPMMFEPSLWARANIISN